MFVERRTVRQFSRCSYFSNTYILIIIYSDVSASTSKRCATPVNKRRTRHEAKQEAYQQKFKESWSSNPAFKGWLASNDRDPYVAKCIACNAELKCGKSELLKHSATTKHKKNVVKKQGTQTIIGFLKSTPEQILHKKKM